VSDFPKFVEFHEEGPREGFQLETTLHPLESRIRFIDALSHTGLTQIQVGSLVNPKKVPTMADTPELFARIEKVPSVKYTALWLNKLGFLKALELPGVTLEGWLYFYASDALARANNDRPAEQMRLEQLDFVQLYEQHQVPVTTASIMCAFGCNLEGEVSTKRVTALLSWIREITVGRGHALPTLMLADTMGWASPERLKQLIGAVRDIEPDMRIGTHIHDTRGLGLANVYAALQMGVDLFDSSVAGLGGCPFASHKAKNTAGNICTEDAVFLCEELGIQTGIDLDALIEAANIVEDILGNPSPGKVMHSGSLSRFRQTSATPSISPLR